MRDLVLPVNWVYGSYWKYTYNKEEEKWWLSNEEYDLKQKLPPRCGHPAVVHVWQWLRTRLVWPSVCGSACLLPGSLGTEHKPHVTHSSSAQHQPHVTRSSVSTAPTTLLNTRSSAQRQPRVTQTSAQHRSHVHTACNTQPTAHSSVSIASIACYIVR